MGAWGVDEGGLKQRHCGGPAGLASGWADVSAGAVAFDGLGSGAVQLLLCEGRLFDKPASWDEACQNLQFFRGKNH